LTIGDRAQVKIKGHADTCVYLYTHWGGYRVEMEVRKALALKERWDDDEYLARIIFCEMIGDNTEGTTGYGIGTGEHGDIGLLITVDTVQQDVLIHHVYADYDDKKFSFEDFINE